MDDFAGWLVWTLLNQRIQGGVYVSSCFDVVYVSLALWLNFIIHDCKKRNILHEKKCHLQNPKKWGARKNGQQLGSEKKKWGIVQKIGYLGYKEINAT